MIFSGLALALRRQKVDEAVKLIQSKIDSGDVRAASLHVRCGKDVFQQGFGAAKAPRSVFLLASISKPMTASAVMLLSDRGKLSHRRPRPASSSPNSKAARRIASSSAISSPTPPGFPDMLPENEDLRKRHAPLKDFVAATCKTPLLFSPGTKVKYQSMGILLAAEIVQRVSDRTLPDFLRDEIYRPLGMRDTSMDLGGRAIPDTMQCQVDEPTDYDWNSAYWRNLGVAVGRRALHRRRRRALPRVLRAAHAAGPQARDGRVDDRRPYRRFDAALGPRLDALPRLRQAVVARRPTDIAAPRERSAGSTRRRT